MKPSSPRDRPAARLFASLSTAVGLLPSAQMGVALPPSTNKRTVSTTSTIT
ncbi:hypothetical protein PF005_g24603 [Phytophthora fragariae]|uniref:Uncharacterized protein n=1 Tax=Phytophthora fragariae TaxID=53985 RepID=A0A6A3HWQ4_9STRA|nr:hypothetical protein PF003_g36929 [Phytophthora fragariae]KAE8924394.1 hypothetical protein PF009_g25370 [Phytophthora fragariae]KAE8974131.1 hypothetical protein PF011_g24983 [Phytophthora fragariae]KAE9072094.1 hypothetical protein PF010_g25624 [Phytophthora fragariae]KAE9076507.1 hypothetical protein PF007_g24603 [Phytophthora fragariae]